MIKQKILPVIICGGTGSRLWPISRASFPKQYLEISIDVSNTFLQETINRFRSKDDFEDPIFICNEEHRFIVAEQIRQKGVKANSILLEPTGRNTAPAITVACLKAQEMFGDPILLILPADHIIQNNRKFIEVIKKAVNYANKNRIVTFGISPVKPETGYGYIESRNDLDYENLKGEEIIRFFEKPNKEKAEKFIKHKTFSWNSGMFLFKASTMLNEIKIKEPEIFALCRSSLKGNNFDLNFQRLNKETFSKCKNISIDKAIMESTKLAIVFPLKVGWSDIGSWHSMWEIGKKDKKGNVISGEVLTKNVKNSYLRSEKRLLVGIGLEDLVIVETSDAILVSKKDHTQLVKDIVKYLELNNKVEANIHKTIFRPWGKYTSISEGHNWQVKKIIVNPGQSLSLQMHNYRTEHWIVVKGLALVQLNDEEKILRANESTFIPISTKHRLSNPGKDLLIIIEVQSGNYLGEDDIIRFNDAYGRE